MFNGEHLCELFLILLISESVYLDGNRPEQPFYICTIQEIRQVSI